jgi:hypothetical protein
MPFNLGGNEDKEEETKSQLSLHPSCHRFSKREGGFLF